MLPTVNNLATIVSLAVETKGLLFLWLAHLNNKSNVCKHISSLYAHPSRHVMIMIMMSLTMKLNKTMVSKE